LPSGDPRPQKFEKSGLHVTGLINNAASGTTAFHKEEMSQRKATRSRRRTVRMVDISHAFMVAALRGTKVYLIKTGRQLVVTRIRPHYPKGRLRPPRAFVLRFTRLDVDESRGTACGVTCDVPGAPAQEYLKCVGTDADDGRHPPDSRETASIQRSSSNAKNRPPSVVSGAENKIMALVRRFLSRRNAGGVSLPGADEPRSSSASPNWFPNINRG